jgi:hypothetical protein
MAGGKTDTLELSLLNQVLGGAAYTAPVTVHMALYSASPGETGGGTELTGGAYARQAITNNATNFPAGNPKSNGTAITFPVATANWARAYSWGLLDAASGGTLLYYGGLINAEMTGYADSTANTITRPAHGLANGTILRVFGLGSAALPTPLALDTQYFVVATATNTFQLSTTSGGAALSITAAGFLEFAVDRSIVISSGGQASFAAGQLVIAED